MEVIATPTYYITQLTDKEYKLLTACVGLASGYTSIRVDQREAQVLNLKLLETRASYAKQMADQALKVLEKAKEGLPATI